MGEKSKIEWTHHTFNPWIGCSKVSQGCTNCYAEELMDKRIGRVQWGDNGTRSRTSEGTWREPLRWHLRAKNAGRRERVFCASLADIAEDREELERWREDLKYVIRATSSLDWLLLTKRPENLGRFYLPGSWNGWYPDNVWLGTSVENQQTTHRIDALRAEPARIRFLSMEPLLSDPGELNLTGIHWVIVGGESGRNARPMEPSWVKAIQRQCQEQEVAFFFKQWGGRDKDKGGRELDGRTWDEVPGGTQP